MKSKYKRVSSRTQDCVGRTTNTSLRWSDIDLATHGIVGDRHRLGRLALDLEDTDIPQTCDVLAYEAISHVLLKRHVDKVGIVIYRRDAGTS